MGVLGSGVVQPEHKEEGEGIAAKRQKGHKFWLFHPCKQEDRRTVSVGDGSFLEYDGFAGCVYTSAPLCWVGLCTDFKDWWEMWR